MVKQLLIYESPVTDPWYNLALEGYLLEHVKPGQLILYLWQNQNTVVIGRNQNPWAECRISLLEQECGRLARRLSGGGAVFHDLGNLNFTFITEDSLYDVPKQLSVIQAACKGLGIEAVPSGRNDLLVEGRKFSGNAFYHSQGKAYHHGTLLIHADMDKLTRYLSPSKAKLEAKGVASVRSRVANLREFAPELSCEDMRNAMKSAFSEVYGLPFSPLIPDADFRDAVAAEAETYGSWQWLFGKQLPFTFQCEDRFPWGSLQLQLDVQAGVIREAKVYSDAMDWRLAPRLEKALTGIRFTLETLLDAIGSLGLEEDIARNIQGFIEAQVI